MKILKAANRDPEPIALPLLTLFPIVDTKDWMLEKLHQSIEKEGMRDPIVVAKIKVSDWRADKNPDIHQAPAWLSNSAEVYRVQRGNNRLQVARDLGYDAIDCIVVDTIMEACVLGDAIMRKNKTWIADIER